MRAGAAARGKRVDQFLRLQQEWQESMNSASKPITVTINPPLEEEGGKRAAGAKDNATVLRSVVSSHTTAPVQLTRGACLLQFFCFAR